MSTQILATKLFIPAHRPSVVTRPRLIERLNDGLYRKLTLISAPAGFGKTTLVSEWLAGCGRPAAWLSLDEGDSDPTRFLRYFVAALQTIAAHIGAGLSDVLQSPQPLPIEATLTVLLNEIAAIPDHFILVLDDYHVIDAQPIDDILLFVLEHLPAQMHLAITTREDPQLPLARLRVRGQLTELRAADLRFTPREADTFLTQGMGLNLSEEDITALETRTEGWVAGLQLAALSLQGNRDISGFIRTFAGNHRYIVDYLIEEVLKRQPEAIRRFLLQTAILDRLTGPLCDAVTGQQGGKALLEALERGNYFVVPLDEKRHWYRYHHLFADVLTAHLSAEQPNDISALHERASIWFEQNDLQADAIRHALAAEDFERSANLIERAAPPLLRARQEATVLGWLQALPSALFRNRPNLSIQYVGTLLSSGTLDGVEERLRDAERWMGPNEAIPGRLEAKSAEMIIADEAEFRALPGSVAMYRAGQALALGNVPDTLKYAQCVLDLALEADYFRRGAAASLLGLAYWTTGDLESAHRSYADGMASLRKAGNITDSVGGSIALADIEIVQGRLHQAMHTYERALQVAVEHGNPQMRGTADMYVGMSELYREYNNLDAATQHLLTSKAHGEHTGFRQNPFRWCVAMSRIRESENDLDGALDLLQEAERLYVSDMYPNVRPVAALKTRVWIAQGKLGNALDWARGQNLSIDDDLSYLHEFEYITLVRLLLAQARSDHGDRFLPDALRLLKRLLKAAEDGERTGRVIEILVLQALANQMHGDIPAALLSLERALTLAEPAGYVRMFIDEGPPMAALLEEAAELRIAPGYVRQLMTAFGKTDDRSSTKPALTDRLSERELEVLRLLATDMNGPEIAHELIVSLNTLRTHTKNIFSKLGVTNRRAAIRRAEELELL